MCGHWAGEIAFIYQNNRRNVSITLQSKSSLYLENQWRKVIYIWIYFDSSHSEVFVDVWLSLDKSIRELPYLVYKIINK